jgi:hypothetical protein
MRHAARVGHARHIGPHERQPAPRRSVAAGQFRGFRRDVAPCTVHVSDSVRALTKKPVPPRVFPSAIANTFTASRRPRERRLRRLFFRSRQGSRFEQHRVGNGEFADIVQQGAPHLSAITTVAGEFITARAGIAGCSCDSLRVSAALLSDDDGRSCMLSVKRMAMAF